MEQEVYVNRIIDGDTAEILLHRKSACSGDCGHCGGCASIQQVVKAEALNLIQAPVGARVVVQCETGKVLQSAVLVYLIPIITFFAGYAVGSLLDFYPGLVSLIFFVLGLIPAVVSNYRLKKNKKSIFQIIRYADKQPGTGENEQ